METTVRPSGTVTRKVHSALSLRVVGEREPRRRAFGSEPTNAPSSVCRKPYGEPNTIGEPTIVCGSRRSATVDLERRALARRLCGVIRSSWPSRLNVGAASFDARPR